MQIRFINTYEDTDAEKWHTSQLVALKNKYGDNDDDDDNNDNDGDDDDDDKRQSSSRFHLC